MELLLGLWPGAQLLSEPSDTNLTFQNGSSQSWTTQEFHSLLSGPRSPAKALWCMDGFQIIMCVVGDVVE